MILFFVTAQSKAASSSASVDHDFPTSLYVTAAYRDLCLEHANAWNNTNVFSFFLTEKPHSAPLVIVLLNATALIKQTPAPQSPSANRPGLRIQPKSSSSAENSLTSPRVI